MPTRSHCGVKVLQQKMEGGGSFRIHGGVWGLLRETVEQIEEMRRQGREHVSYAFGVYGRVFRRAR